MHVGTVISVIHSLTLQTFLLTLHADNQERRDKKGKVPPVAAEFGRTLEEWLEDFGTFAEHVSLSLTSLASNLDEEIARRSSPRVLRLKISIKSSPI